MQFYVAELCLCQIGIKSTEHSAGSTDPRASATQQKELVFSGLRASEALFKMYLSFPTNYALGLNNIQWIQMGFSLLVASKLVLATTKAAPHASSSQRINWMDTMSQLHDRMESLSDARTDKDGEHDVFGSFSRRVSRVMSWLGMKPQSQGCRDGETIALPEIPFTGDSTTGEVMPGNAHLDSSVDPAPIGWGFDVGSDVDLSQDAYFTAAFNQIMDNWF